MEMFVLSYVNVLCIYPQTVFKFHQMAQNLLDKPVCYTQILFPYLCKQSYLYGNLPFCKIQVNRFMAWDELSGAILSFKAFLSFH